MNPTLSKLTRWVLWALLGLFLATSAAAFEFDGLLPSPPGGKGVGAGGRPGAARRVAAG